jgi:hypothetical protein
VVIAAVRFVGTPHSLPPLPVENSCKSLGGPRFVVNTARKVVPLGPITNLSISDGLRILLIRRESEFGVVIMDQRHMSGSASTGAGLTRLAGITKLAIRMKTAKNPNIVGYFVFIMFIIPLELFCTSTTSPANPIDIKPTKRNLDFPMQ